MDDKTNRVLIEIVKIYVVLMFVILMETSFYVTTGNEMTSSDVRPRKSSKILPKANLHQ